jgi:hypothetical protein
MICALELVSSVLFHWYIAANPKCARKNGIEGGECELESRSRQQNHCQINMKLVFQKYLSRGWFGNRTVSLQLVELVLTCYAISGN